MNMCYEGREIEKICGGCKCMVPLPDVTIVRLYFTPNFLFNFFTFLFYIIDLRDKYTSYLKVYYDYRLALYT